MKFYLSEFSEEVQDGIRQLVRDGRSSFKEDQIEEVKNYMGRCGKPVLRFGDNLVMKGE
ncbi:MAG: hypothetical protein AWU54_456 [Candidatus Frackibacter sp. T328-2]|nr:MAG: hypothetical protein AWU54_456 [Candidatus Frackibacter sp. T328-2]